MSSYFLKANLKKAAIFKGNKRPSPIKGKERFLITPWSGVYNLF
jgi:hypothetical protein